MESSSCSFHTTASGEDVESDFFANGGISSSGALPRSVMERLEKMEEAMRPRRRSPRKRKPVKRYDIEEEEEKLFKPNHKRNKSNYLAITNIKLPSNSKNVDFFPLRGLPLEILMHIISFLGVKDVCCLSQVSKDLAVLANDPVIWKGLCYRRWQICDVIMYDFNWKLLYIDNNQRTERGWHRYEIKDFSKKLDSPESFYSEPFRIGSHTWTILVFPRASTGPYLSVYLSVRNTAPLGNREASFSFVLVNQKDDSKSVKKDSLYGNFMAEVNGENDREDWGFTKFIELEKVVDSSEGFIVNDTLVLLVYVANLSELDYWITLLNAQDESLQLEATNAVVQSSFVDDNKHKIVKKGGLRPILDFLSSDNIDLQKSASDALWNLTAEDTNKELVLELGGLPQVVSLLGCSDVDVQRNIVNVCWNLSTIDRLKRRIEQCGGIPLVIELLKSKIADIHLSAVMVLWNISTLEEIKDKIVQLGAVGPLTQLLYSNNDEVLLNTISLLWNLAEETENSMQIIKMINLDLLMPLLYNKNPEITKNTLYLLGSLAEGNATFIIKVEEKSGVKYLINLLFSDNEEIVGEAANALSKLMYYHRIKNVSEAVIERLLDMLQSQSEILIETAILALLKVALHEQNKLTITKLGGLDIIIPLLQKKSFGIQGDSSIVITNLATNPWNKKKILEKGALDYLLPLLSSDKYPKNFAACAIASLLEDGEAQRKLLERGQLNLLLDYLINSSDYLEGPSHISVAIVKMGQPFREQVAAIIKEQNILQCILSSLLSYDPSKSQSQSQSQSQFPTPTNYINNFGASTSITTNSTTIVSSFLNGMSHINNNSVNIFNLMDKKEEKKEGIIPPHIALCCSLNLLGYFSMIGGGIHEVIQELGGVFVVKEILRNFGANNIHISFLGNWALYLIKTGPVGVRRLYEGYYTATDFMKVSPDRLHIRNDSCFFESILRTTRYVHGSGKYYYEAECVSANVLSLIGWATNKHQFHIAERKGVGDDLESWSYEPRRGIKWTDGFPMMYGHVIPKTSNYIVGCSLDLDVGEMKFSLNGKDLGVAFGGLDCSAYYCPAFSLTSGQQCHLNFGSYSFKWLPEGYVDFEGNMEE